MRAIIFLALFLSSVIAIYAQDNSSNKKKNEVGYDMLPLISNIFGSPTSSDARLNLRRHMGKLSLRLRLGGSVYRRNDQSDSTLRINQRHDYTIALGLERTQKIIKWFEIHYGFELIHSYDYVYSVDESTQYDSYYLQENEVYTNSIGASLFLGFGVRLHDRVRIMTESRHKNYFSFGNNYTKSHYTYPGNNNYIIREETLAIKTWTSTYVLPNTLVLNFSF